MSQWYESNPALLEAEEDAIETRNGGLPDGSKIVPFRVPGEPHYAVRASFALPDRSTASIEIFYPSSFPALAPVVRILKPEIPPTFKFRLYTGASRATGMPACVATDATRRVPCLFQTWRPDGSIVTVYNAAREFLERFTYWKHTGRWLEKTAPRPSGKAG